MAQDLADVLGRSEGRAQYQFIGIGRPQGLSSSISIVDDTLLTRGLGNHTAWDQTIRLPMQLLTQLCQGQRWGTESPCCILSRLFQQELIIFARLKGRQDLVIVRLAS